MKYHGKKIESRNYEYCVIPRPDGNIVFKAESVLDLKEFHALVPKPTPPEKVLKNGQRVVDFQAPVYQALLNDYSQKRMDYMTLKSLEATEGLEWETVDFSNPDSWRNFEQELKDSNFTELEIMQIITATHIANSMNQSKLDEARDAFLASLQTPQDNGSSSQKDVNMIMQSGEPVND